MKKSELKQLIKEEIQSVLKEGGADKYIGKWEGKFNMYRDDEGNTYINGKNTNWNPVAIADEFGEQRSREDIIKDIRATFNRQSDRDWKAEMRGY